MDISLANDLVLEARCCRLFLTPPFVLSSKYLAARRRQRPGDDHEGYESDYRLWDEGVLPKLLG